MHMQMIILLLHRMLQLVAQAPRGDPKDPKKKGDRVSRDGLTAQAACRGLLSLATVALALTGADAFDFHNFDHKAFNHKNFDVISGSVGKGFTHSTRTTHHSSGFKVHKAEVKCSSSSYAATYTDWKNSYINAGAPSGPSIKDGLSHTYTAHSTQHAARTDARSDMATVCCGVEDAHMRLHSVCGKRYRCMFASGVIEVR